VKRSSVGQARYPPLWVQAILLMPAIDGAQIGLFCRAEGRALESRPLYSGLAFDAAGTMHWIVVISIRLTRL
jgi:hypothetical protein